MGSAFSHQSNIMTLTITIDIGQKQDDPTRAFLKSPTWRNAGFKITQTRFTASGRVLIVLEKENAIEGDFFLIKGNYTYLTHAWK